MLPRILGSEARDEKAAARRSREIDEQLQLELRQMREVVNFLCLGISESKRCDVSETFHHIRYIQRSEQKYPFVDERLPEYRLAILNDLLFTVWLAFQPARLGGCDLVEQADEMEQAWKVVENLEVPDFGSNFSREAVKAIKDIFYNVRFQIWLDQEARKGEIFANGKLYAKNIDRLLSPQFVPNPEELALMPATRTKKDWNNSIRITDFEVDGKGLRVMNINSNSSTKKLMNRYGLGYDIGHAIVHVASLLFYRESFLGGGRPVLDDSKSLLEEDLDVLTSIASSDQFTGKPFVLIFTNKKRFTDTIDTRILKRKGHFPESHLTEKNGKAWMELINKRYVEILAQAGRECWVYYTDAGDKGLLTFLAKIADNIRSKRKNSE